MDDDTKRSWLYGAGEERGGRERKWKGEGEVGRGSEVEGEGSEVEGRQWFVTVVVWVQKERGGKREISEASLMSGGNGVALCLSLCVCVCVWDRDNSC